MSPHSSFLTIIPFLLTLATAIPTSLETRDDRPTGPWTCGPQCSHVVFDPAQATCANNKYMKQFSTSVTVDVRQDCDPVINTICKAADKLAQGSNSMTNLVHTAGSCEGHMLFSSSKADPKTVNYDSCVQAFQGITESCMLMGDPSVHNSASVGKQFGVQNVVYQEVASGNNWLTGNTYQQTDPGYLMGPTGGVWGTNTWGNQQEASDVLNPSTA